MVYLDAAATQKSKFFAKDCADYWMNTNSSYSIKEQTALEDAKNRIKSCLGVKSGKVIFGRCATELVEWLSNKLKFNSITCSPWEHDSVFDACNKNVLNPSKTKEFDIFSTYAHQYVNQMTGKIFSLEQIEKQIHKYDDGYSFFLSDFTAAIGHAPIPKNLDSFCDAIWFSGHKFHAEKGMGAMWLSDRLCAYLSASESPRNNYSILHGTTALPSILALTDALEYTISNFPKNEAKYRELHDYMFHYAMSKGLYIYEKITDSCPAINAVSVPFCNSDALCNYLASKEIYVAHGYSACAESADYRVLESFGYTQEQAEQTIRVSFGEDNTLADVEALIDNIIAFKSKFN